MTRMQFPNSVTVAAMTTMLLVFLLGTIRTEGFTTTTPWMGTAGSHRWYYATSESKSEITAAAAAATEEETHSYEPVFDFSENTASVVSSFDRIDDAIMGGISTSSLRPSGDNDDESFGVWSGVCRTDGGGFCGTRTLPFRDGIPLDVDASGDGFYLRARLVSDNEPDRRVWKLTTRVENNARTEQLYQAMFEVPKQEEADDNNEDAKWKMIRVPFDSFVQVRGPRIVENGPPLDTSGGLYQIGLVLSKFRIASNTTEFENFRPGYFCLQIRDIGVYRSSTVTGTSSSAEATSSSNAVSSIQTPVTVTKNEADRNRPPLLKLLFPIVKIFFNEKRNRQQSAARILKKRGMSKMAIARFGFRRKVAHQGIVLATIRSFVESVGALVRQTAFWTLKLAVFYPLVAIRRMAKKLTKPKTPSAAQSPQNA